ncbi:tRNA (adenosine(37)-N6)-threonylcarbamoyltransferase complex transferase subunit TsaD [Mycoplasma sp. 'Moose RK']|uniref:tRNA (adenosine(37)-N6)-threonylcarbamoyltransferase complex transferase subunit TsaD n=1 Tax=Mycoplasma sp. 'Moose RK' TaxID=2780095 RepID=UPI0018C28556|nr:tRNA (adenosine(37)-N6)-threonylcarbamoyltransferase complex transferase subunit TsaD [Mycoplasma sp. 'Moose RK']MBG0730948.1 tRNA (adenosine(37)-N6)-threonylcarbamoyltransferase complex transferase subunit TsaD [Mycoplasma sp. 'Moose RK']
MKILGIETSHDDASIALIEENSVKILLTISQISIHEKFGGTVPELAAREHSRNLAIILQKLLAKKVDFSTLDAIAYTENPGLIGPLKMGFLFASALAIFFKKKLIPINHLSGHFWSASIEKNLDFPVLSLLISGGHSQLIWAKSPTNLQIIGTSIDDALGEIYDKIARNLKLGFPGGPKIDLICQEKIQKKLQLIEFTLPKTLENPLNFSFSGLKTQVINYIHQLEQKKEINPEKVKEIAISFQKTVVKYLKRQLDLALKMKKNIKTITLVGGVAANSEIRKLIESYAEKFKIVIPEKKFCTDNGAMIAKAAQILLENSEEK